MRFTHDESLKQATRNGHAANKSYGVRTGPKWVKHHNEDARRYFSQRLTLRAVLDSQGTDDPPETASLFVKCVTGIDASEIAEIAGGLNTSQQVDLKSLENLRDHFEKLKQKLKGEPYADKIAYKMNEDKPVDVREVLYYLAVFDGSVYSDKAHPVALFGRKEGIVRRFAEQAGDVEGAGNSFDILISKAPEILRLRDLIEKKVLERLDGRYKASRATRVWYPEVIAP